MATETLVMLETQIVNGSGTVSLGSPPAGKHWVFERWVVQSDVVSGAIVTLQVKEAGGDIITNVSVSATDLTDKQWVGDKDSTKTPPLFVADGHTLEVVEGANLGVNDHASVMALGIEVTP